ncbi:predicted protein [Postia placenta Mad-698-R]|uniref:C2H2-type domain-containing protein n=1 Tax=Postia placenta MAD-698-R-SB12 TaxID=670580 RepID=A0A1X6N022_9APHY|nr:hypothetical protein POSPLADRAFT_1046463 [Postia placenta MAD-698-R-SB12]EED82700.1 predicted protein [Postia placenta Mad-698-R]OSX61971.1 hypothetical protein POSPLADRAFT_1046463 [Postia placenta MAD-698-R-SB12]
MSHIISHLTTRLRNALLCSDPHLDQQTLFVIIDRPASLKASYDVDNHPSMPSVPPIRIRAPAIASALSNSKNCTHIYLDPTTYIPVVNTLGQVATITDPLSPVLVRKDRSLVFWQYEHHSIAQDVAETYHKIRHYARTYDCDKVTPRSATSPYTLFIGEEYAASSNTRAARRQRRDVTAPLQPQRAKYASGTTPVRNIQFAGNMATAVPFTVWAPSVAVTAQPARERKHQRGQLSISTTDAPAAPPLANRDMLPLPRRVSHATGSGPPMVGQNTATIRYGSGYSSKNTTSVSSSASTQHITRLDEATAVDDIDGYSPRPIKRARSSGSTAPSSASRYSTSLSPTSTPSTSPPSTPASAPHPATRRNKGKQRALPYDGDSDSSSSGTSAIAGPQFIQPSAGISLAPPAEGGVCCKGCGQSFARSDSIPRHLRESTHTRETSLTRHFNTCRVLKAQQEAAGQT